MSLVESLNRAIYYIEENLDKEISLEELARITGTSKYHFQRIFTAISDITLQEYIRNRRLSLAAVELRDSRIRITDLAQKYGYSDSASFSRAFKNFHGISPSLARREGYDLSSFPPMNFSIEITGGIKMDYKIVSKGPFKVYGISTALTDNMQENLKTVPEFWKKARENGQLEKLIEEIKEEPVGILGINSFEDEKNKYYIAVSSNNKLDNLDSLEIPESDWAVFTGKGNLVKMQEHGKDIFLKWLPSNGFVHRDIPDLEIYKNDDPENLIYEFWIPISRKSH